jgi:hypothetical protein
LKNCCPDRIPRADSQSGRNFATKKEQENRQVRGYRGGRRLAALNLLIANGRLPKNHEVDCRVVEHKEALENKPV